MPDEEGVQHQHRWLDVPESSLSKLQLRAVKVPLKQFIVTYEIGSERYSTKGWSADPDGAASESREAMGDKFKGQAVKLVTIKEANNG